MQIIHFSGNLGKDPETRDVSSGDSVTSFSVGAKNGYGRDASTTWYRVSVWGKRGVTLAGMLAKGTPVAVCGDLTIGEYQGKPQYDVRAHDVALFGSKSDRPQVDRGAPASSSYDSDLDDDLGSDSVPF